MQKRRALRSAPSAGDYGPLLHQRGTFGRLRSSSGRNGAVATRQGAVLAATILCSLAFSGGCREQPQGGQSTSALCNRACSAASCGQPSASGGCGRGCLLEGSRAAAVNCEGEHRRLLVCIAGARAACDATCQGADCLGAKRVTGCVAERKKLKACMAPCAHEGLSHHLTRKTEDGTQTLKLEVVRSGCGRCKQAPRSGAQAGAPCTAASVCNRHCCQCEGGNARHTVRACVAGKCASAERACALAQQEVKGLCSGGL